jgi:hypothetical protein
MEMGTPMEKRRERERDSEEMELQRRRKLRSRRDRPASKLSSTMRMNFFLPDSSR